MAAKAWYSRISKMVPPIPLGPPLPRRELIALLERVRKVIDQTIVQLKRDAKPAARSRSRRTR